MKMSIAVTRRANTVSRSITLYFDEKSIKYLFKSFNKVDRVVVGLSKSAKGIRIIRVTPLPKGDLAPGGVLPISLKKTNGKDKQWVGTVVIPKSWNLELASRNRSNLEEFVFGTTEDNLESCIDIPILVDWLETSNETAGSYATSASVPDSALSPTVDEKEVAISSVTTPKLDKVAKKKKPPAVKTDIDVDTILNEAKKAAIHLNLQLALLSNAGVRMEGEFKDNQISLSRIIPAKKKRVI